MTTDMSALATKKDLAQELAKVRGEMATKNDVKAAVQEMKLYFDAAVENFEDRIRVIDTDKWKDHDDRIKHLEVIMGA